MTTIQGVAWTTMNEAIRVVREAVRVAVKTDVVPSTDAPVVENKWSNRRGEVTAERVAVVAATRIRGRTRRASPGQCHAIEAHHHRNIMEDLCHVIPMTCLTPEVINKKKLHEPF